MSSTGIDPEVARKIALWHPSQPETWPDWYVWTGGWYEMDGEEKYYTAYDDLGDGAVVFDVGSYEGEWLSRMHDKYPRCVYHGFEPAQRAYQVSTKRLGQFGNVHLHNFGLGVSQSRRMLYDSERDSATFIDGGKLVPALGQTPNRMAEIVSIREFMESEQIEWVNLAAINIEGMEFELLPYLIGSTLIRRFERLMIQWHSVVDDAAAIQQAIQAAIAKTHSMIWNLGAWELWRLKQKQED